MVGVLQNDDVVRARLRARHANRQFIRFASRIDEMADLQRFRQKFRETFRIAKNIFVQIARIRIEKRQLFLRRLNNVRVTVSNQWHVVVNVQIRSPRFVV